MGYQPKTSPELKYPPGNPNVYCGECNAIISDGMYQCPECGKSFPSRLPLSPFTGGTMLTAGKVSTREAINGLRAVYGYEPLPEDKPEYEDMIVPYPQIDI